MTLHSSHIFRGEGDLVDYFVTNAGEAKTWKGSAVFLVEQPRVKVELPLMKFAGAVSWCLALQFYQDRCSVLSLFNAIHSPHDHDATT